MSLNACSDNTQTWDEEVKLLDDRVIVVTQKRLLLNGARTREAWLTMNLPEFSPQPIVWHEALEPMILNIFNGRLYVVATPPSPRENTQYGKPNPSYIGYRWNGSAWDRIPFSEIPEVIYDGNLVLHGYYEMTTKFLKLEQKNSPTMNNSIELPKTFKRVDPTTNFFN